MPAFLLRTFASVLLALASPALSAEFYVAPNGLDTQPGTQAQPFATIQRAQLAVKPGDTVIIRGGKYRMREDQIARRSRLYADVTHLNKSGAQGAPLTYRAADGEKPVFDFSEVKPRGLRVAAFHVSGSWIHLKGLEVTGVQVTITRHTQSICFYNNGSHNVYEQLNMHDGQAIGIYSLRGGHNLFLNCDAWQNHDFTSENGRGGNVDGFGCHPVAGAVGNVFRGCRAWLNSDDGFDLISASEAVTFENCWAFRNGLAADGKRLADGNGFKAGGYGSWKAAQLPQPVPRHVIRFCVASQNPAAGFYANHHPGGGDWVHNSAFANGTNFSFLGRLADNLTDIPGTGHKILYNVSFRSRRAVAHLNAEQCQLEGNLFEGERLPSDSDFAGTDPAQLALPRKPDGSLPDISFLHPSPASRLGKAGAFPAR